MRQHNIWCVCMRPVWRGMLDSGFFTFLTNFKISGFNKEHTSFLKMI